MKHKFNPLATSPYGFDTTVARGLATAPAASADVVTLAAPAAGRYVLDILLIYAAGTPAAPEDSNWKLRFNGADFTQFSTSRVVGAQHRFQVAVTLDGTNPVTLRAHATSTAGVVYNGQITAQRIE